MDRRSIRSRSNFERTARKFACWITAGSNRSRIVRRNTRVKRTHGSSRNSLISNVARKSAHAETASTRKRKEKEILGKDTAYKMNYLFIIGVKVDRAHATAILSDCFFRLKVKVSFFAMTDLVNELTISPIACYGDCKVDHDRYSISFLDGVLDSRSLTFSNYSPSTFVLWHCEFNFLEESIPSTFLDFLKQFTEQNQGCKRYWEVCSDKHYEFCRRWLFDSRYLIFLG